MESTRQQKVSRLLQKEIGNYLQREAHTVCGGKMVSVTGVKVTPDLGLARVNLSIFPSAQAKDILLIVKTHKKQIRYAIGHEVRHQLRIIPELEFYIDDSLDYINRIDELLKK
jgi:ribosome-binding factor A